MAERRLTQYVSREDGARLNVMLLQIQRNIFSTTPIGAQSQRKSQPACFRSRSLYRQNESLLILLEELQQTGEVLLSSRREISQTIQLSQPEGRA